MIKIIKKAKYDEMVKSSIVTAKQLVKYENDLNIAEENKLFFQNECSKVESKLEKSEKQLITSERSADKRITELENKNDERLAELGSEVKSNRELTNKVNGLEKMEVKYLKEIDELKSVIEKRDAKFVSVKKVVPELARGGRVTTKSKVINEAKVVATPKLEEKAGKNLTQAIKKAELGARKPSRNVKKNKKKSGK